MSHHQWLLPYLEESLFIEPDEVAINEGDEYVIRDLLVVIFEGTDHGKIQLRHPEHLPGVFIQCVQHAIHRNHL